LVDKDPDYDLKLKEDHIGNYKENLKRMKHASF